MAKHKKSKASETSESNANEDKPIVHLVCQAHIDPVWMWPWQEGAREAISTYHTAADLLEEFPEFIFNHNESLLYEWVEENDPALFERIRKLVKAARWHIAGGWYLQPDVNQPGGETIVRLIEEGRRYFQDTFGVRAKVAYNFDTFGHPASLPQILKQAGFELYIHCRPPQHVLELPAPLYQWQGHDGTRILALRPDTGWYCTGPAEAGVRTAKMQAEIGIAKARESRHDTLVLWGVGDHGGGPTRTDLNELAELAKATEDVQVLHSTPEAYLKRITSQVDLAQIPVFAGEVQRTFAGCYTSVAPIKRGMRRSEAMLSAAERWSAIAWWRTGLPYPDGRLRKAWKAVMCNTFHDVMCGSLLESALPGVLNMYGYSDHMTAQIAFKAQNALLPSTPPELGHVPMYVFNPHPYPLKAVVGTHFLVDYRPPPGRRPFAIFDDAGNPVPCQTGGGQFAQSSGNFQPHILFVAEVPALTVRRYDVQPNVQPARSTNPLNLRQTLRQIVVENRWLRATFSRATASLESLVEIASGRDLLRGPVRVTPMRDSGDAWGGESNADFNTPVGEFQSLTPEQVGQQWAGEDNAKGDALRVLPNDGAIVPEGMPRTLACTVEGLTGWRRSLASIQVTLYADVPYVDINTRVHWQERRKMAKLVVPLNLNNPQVTCEVPYGIAARAADGSEHAQTRWLRVDEGEPAVAPKRPAARSTKRAATKLAVGLANDGQYGFAVTPEGTVGLSLARGAVHTRWGDAQIEPNENHTFTDQGQIDTRFRLVAGLPDEVAAALVPAALELNEPLDVYATFYPPTPQLDPVAAAQPFLQITPTTVQLGALKKADGEDALIARLVESAGQPTSAILRVDGADDDYTVNLNPYEITTLKIKRGKKGITIKPCGLLDG